MVEFLNFVNVKWLLSGILYDDKVYFKARYASQIFFVYYNQLRPNLVIIYQGNTPKKN
jgi:hypothetical protein